MASGFEDQVKINALPQEGVHCFPANSKQIVSRRIITLILLVVFGAVSVYGFMKMGALLPAAIICCLGAVISVLVFVQTFLIANYRVAIDYNEKNVVLRFRFSNIKIPFESFDARDGSPDKAEALIDGNLSSDKAMYLVLDNVFEDACFQTSTRDLASKEDFLKLKEEAFAIADAYGARNSEDKVRFWNESEKDGQLDDDDIDAIVEAAKEADAEEITPVDEEVAEEETVSVESKTEKLTLNLTDDKKEEDKKEDEPQVETRESRKDESIKLDNPGDSDDGSDKD